MSLPPSPLEMREKLEQLRALEAGMRIDIVVVETVPLGVDTPRIWSAPARSSPRADQESPMKKVIAFQGERGANSEIACHEVYPGWEALPCPTFEDAFAALGDGTPISR